jgi:hypothetical protein
LEAIEMKNLKQYMLKVGVGLYVIPQLLGCGSSPNYDIPMKGTVVSEKYTPGSGGWNSRDSTYNIKVKTSEGVCVINVKDLRSCTRFGERIKKESLDAMVDEGTEIEFDLSKGEVNKQYINRTPNQIKVK